MPLGTVSTAAELWTLVGSPTQGEGTRVRVHVLRGKLLENVRSNSAHANAYKYHR